MFIFLILALSFSSISYASSEDCYGIQYTEEEAVSTLNQSLFYLGRKLNATEAYADDFATFAIYTLCEDPDQREQFKHFLNQPTENSVDISVSNEHLRTPDLKRLDFVFYAMGLFEIDENNRFTHMVNVIAPKFAKGSSFYEDKSPYGFRSIFSDFLKPSVYHTMYKELACNDTKSPYDEYFTLNMGQEESIQHLTTSINFNDLSNFDSCHEKITSALDHTEEAELHFFWTTGKTPPEGFDPNPNPKVLIGGIPEYGDNFFLYVEALLKNSPEKLTIRFIYDEKTFNSNKEEIEALQREYPNRFLIEHVNKVRERLKTNFPQHEESIDHAFENATWGNPAVASDFYRLVGMYFGFDRDLNKNPPQLTYSDVDTFIHGMAHKKYEELIEAFFGESDRVSKRDSFAIFKRKDNNDLIKIRIGNIEDYKRDFGKVLEVLNVPTKQTNFYNSLLSFEENVKDLGAEAKKAEFRQICKRSNLSFDDIIFGTGPAFFNNFKKEGSLVEYRDYLQDPTFNNNEERMSNFKRDLKEHDLDLDETLLRNPAFHELIQEEGKLPEFSEFLRDNLVTPEVCTLTWDPMNGNGEKIILTPFFTFPWSKENVEKFEEIKFIQLVENYIGVIRSLKRSSFMGHEHPFHSYAEEYLKSHFPYTASQNELRTLMEGSYLLNRQNSKKINYIEGCFSLMVKPWSSELKPNSLNPDERLQNRWEAGVSHYQLSKSFMYGLGMLFPPFEQLALCNYEWVKEELTNSN